MALGHSEQIYFNLFVNSACSFAAGMFMVYLTFELFRIGTSRWRLAFLTLPFLKILWDMHFGIPGTSYLYHHIDPLMVPPKHKTITIGLGLENYHPVFNFMFTVFNQPHHSFSISAADFIWVLLKRADPRIPGALLLGLVSISFILIVRRIIGMTRFETKRRKIFADPLKTGCLETRSLILRQVRILVSNEFSGTPFTGGVFKPYICIPAESEKMLSRQERDAVICHELAHVRYFDLLINVFIRTLGDIFWFIPGYRWMSRKIDRLREILADDAAVKMGGSPFHLASALLKIKDAEQGSNHPVLYSAFFKDRSLLKERVARLTGTSEEEKPARFGWNHPKLRWLIAVIMALTVFSANLGGNHEIKPLPPWLTKWFASHGWHVE